MTEAAIEKTGRDALKVPDGYVCTGYKYKLPKIYGDTFVRAKTLPAGAVNVHAYYEKVPA